MIASLRGRLIFTDNTSVVVECGGVGLRCMVTKNTLYRLPQKGNEVFLHTFLAVREDSLDLYGFHGELVTFFLGFGIDKCTGEYHE